MAQRIITELIDDMDGSTADETVTFGLDGATYEVDLSTTNAAELREYLARFVGVARRASGGPKRRPRGSGSSGPSISAQVREWATQNGYDVPSRGRIPTTVMEAYREVHGGGESPTTTPRVTTTGIETTTNSEPVAVEAKPKARKRASKGKPEVAPVD